MFKLALVLLLGVIIEGKLMSYRKIRSIPIKTDEEVLKEFFTLAYHENKSKFISTFISKLASPDYNITLVGWQNVYSSDGTVEMIHTMELVIPPRKGEKTFAEKGDDEEQTNAELVKKLRDYMEPFTSLGVPVSAAYEEYDKDGEQTLWAYVDDRQYFLKEDHFAIYNQTNKVDLDWDNEDISVLTYDEKGAFVEDESRIRPSFHAYVSYYEDATYDMLKSGPEIMANVSIRNCREDIPVQLSREFKALFPNYKWFVLVDPEEFYGSMDVSITLCYDVFNLQENTDISYFVYGRKV